MRLAFGVLLATVLTVPAFAQNEHPPGFENRYSQYYAEIVRVIDGDTIAVKALLWPGLFAEYSVRVRGVDAPELRRVGCEKERQWGEEAKRKVKELYPVGLIIRLDNVEPDPFTGRIVADLRRWRSDRWLYLRDELLDRGLAVEWTPDMADVPWCLLAQTRDVAPK